MRYLVSVSVFVEAPSASSARNIVRDWTHEGIDHAEAFSHKDVKIISGEVVDIEEDE